MKHPDVLDPGRVGTYPALACAGGGYTWDAVLEYRVWWCPAKVGRSGSDSFRAFATHEEALAFSRRTPGAEEPLALVLQREYISEPEPGRFVHVKEERVTEWSVEWLARPPRTDRTIPDFLAAPDRERALAILRGKAP